MNIQAIWDEISAQAQRKRATSQMTLGNMIKVLEAMPPGAEVPCLGNPHSYRGYYCDLAFERWQGMRPAADLIRLCKEAVGKTFVGYKGGDFAMTLDTPVWIADYGCSGHKLMDIDSRVGFEVEGDSE